MSDRSCASCFDDMKELCNRVCPEELAAYNDTKGRTGKDGKDSDDDSDLGEGEEEEEEEEE